MSLPKLLSRMLFTAAALLVSTTPSHGQGVPWYTIPLPLPNGFVDAATGNVHLEIPLASIPERNGDPLVSKAVYDSTYYFYNGGFGPYGPGWQVFTGNSHSGWGSYNSSYQDCSGYSPYTSGQVTTNYFYFVDNHSTSHVLNGLYHTYQVNCYDPTTGIYFGSGSDIPSTSGPAVDGSGYTFTVTNYTALRVNAPDGTLVSGNANAPVDTNGNYSRYSVGSQPDMLGRSPLQFQPSLLGYLCPPSSSSIGIRASDGSTSTYTFTCTSYSVSQVLFGTTYTATENFLTSIALPDGTQYSFTYDTGTTGTHLGQLLTITLPSGGVVSFTYTSLTGGSSLPTLLGTATFAGGTWNLSYVRNGSTQKRTTTVMSPLRYDSVSQTNLSDKTVFTSVPTFAYVQTAQYYSGSSTLLRTVTTTYDNSGIYYLPMTVTTTLNDTGQSSSVSHQYYNNLMRNYPTQEQETDFTGAVVRTTKTTYNPSFMKPTSVKVYAGSGTGSPIASTLYTYDEYAANYCKNGVPMLTNFTGATSHDDTNYGVSFTARGNVTTIQRLISGTTYSTTHMCYDTLGNVTQTVDANGNPTTFDYSENWADTNCIPAGTITHAFPTTITDALGHRIKNSYFTCTSLTQSVKDENDIQAGRNGTTYSYNKFNLPVTINYPDTGQTTFCHSHDPSLPCYTSTLPPFTTQSKLISGSTTLNTKTLMDSYGRVAETQLTSDPDCSSSDKTDTTYDLLGRVLTVSNSYCTTGDTTYGLTTYSYDALGRTTQVMHPDGSTATMSYLGTATSTKDEGNGTQSIQRISQNDALGRLTSLCEVAPGPFIAAGGASSASLIGSAGTPVVCGLSIAGTGFLTTYQYDILGNLLQVNQSGVGSRTFTYDSLSRLLTASNPESGTICYGTYSAGVCQGNGYDANGNLTSKTAPAPNQTGTATVTSSYQYDALNRLIQKSYNDGATPTTTYAFDSYSTGCGTSYLNTVSRLAFAAVPGWSYCYGYDSMGRVMDIDLRTPQNQLHYLDDAYNLLGNMTTETAGYSSVSYAYNTAGRLTSVTSSFSDSQNPANVMSAMHYNAFGGLTSDTLGDNEVETYGYVPKLTRVQSSTAKLSTTTLYNFNIGSFAPNGDILSANDTANGNWVYAYDAFNRLTCTNLSTNGTCASPTNGHPTYSYVYDRFGNRWQQNGPNTFLATFTGNNPGNPQNNNRMDGFSYDATGNLLNDGAHNYKYDAENRLIQVDTGSTATYVYDADGRRIQKTSTVGNYSDPAGTWIYFYDLAGRWVQKFNSPGNIFQQGNIYAGGRHLAFVGGWTSFIHSDWLGTERMRNSYATPTTLETCSNLPFGDALSCVGSDVSPLHFTGKERDADSGLDDFEARYIGSSMGRFMSSDPENLSGLINQDDPQAWNGYVYVRNNPLVYTDPGGTNYSVCDADGKNCAYLTNEQYAQWRKDSPNVSMRPSGDLYVGNTKVGSATYYNEKDIQAAQFLSGPVQNVVTKAGYVVGGAMAAVYAGAAYGTYQLGTTALNLAGAGGVAAPILYKTSDIIDEVVQTPQGPVRIVADVVVEGTSVIIKDVQVYAAETGDRLNIGVGNMLKAIRPLMDNLKDAGYTTLRILGDRSSAAGSANPGRPVDIFRSLR